MADNKKILVTGDSHCIILGNNVVSADPTKISRFADVDVQHIGPALAYTLPMQSSLNAGARLLAYVEARRDDYDAVMLCFGEIDARAHVVKQAVWQGVPLSKVVADLVDHYFQYIDLLISKVGLPVFVWGPIGTMPDSIDFYNPDYPTVGRERERNHATVLINRALAARCDTHPMAHFMSISDQLIDSDLCTQAQYYEDGVHLNRKGMHLAFKEIRKRMLEVGFPHLAERFPEQVYVSDQAMLRDVAKTASIIDMSSSHDPDWGPPLALSNPGHLPFIFHTHLEDHPRVIVDLGCVQMVKQLEILNRRDGFQDRARSLRVGVSTNRYTFDTVFDNASRQTFGADGRPLIVSFEKAGHFRYIQLELQERNYFHLGDLKVWAYSFLNAI